MQGSRLSFRSVIVIVLLSAICLSSAWRIRRGGRSQRAAGTVTLAEPGQRIEIVVHGRDFVWRFLSAGQDGIHGTIDDLVWYNRMLLPPHTPMKFVLRSDDYIYTFSLADLKSIAIPGIDNALQFETPESGSFTLEVDPLCGFRPYHDDIMGTISIDPTLRPGEIHEGDRVAGTE
ncbi:MAG: hypothetical protein ABGZ53_28555 [Fuerstiella sp.]